MPNTNCLEGMRCPECGSYEPLTIAVTTFLTVYDDGGGDSESMEWEEESSCTCCACDFTATVKDFYVEDEDENS